MWNTTMIQTKYGLKALPTGGYQGKVKNVKSGNRPIIL